MSDTIAAAPSSGGAPKIGKINEAVIRIAGNSQDGIQAIGGFLARLAGRSEQEVMTFMTIPSTISGGPSIFQVRIGSRRSFERGRRGRHAALFLPAQLRRPYQISQTRRNCSLRRRPCSAETGMGRKLPPRRREHFQPHRRGRRRHGHATRAKIFSRSACSQKFLISTSPNSPSSSRNVSAAKTRRWLRMR